MTQFKTANEDLLSIVVKCLIGADQTIKHIISISHFVQEYAAAVSQITNSKLLFNPMLLSKEVIF